MELKESARRRLKIFRLGLLVCGCIFFVVAIGLAMVTGVFFRGAVPAKGTVVALAPVYDQESNTDTYRPVFRFKADSGQLYTVDSATSSNPAEFAIGDEIRVLYRKGEPGKAVIDSFGQLWGLAVSLGVVGLVAVGISWGMLRWERRRGPVRLIEW